MEVLPGAVACELSAGFGQLKDVRGCFDLSPKRLPAEAGFAVFVEAPSERGLAFDLFSPVLAPKRFVGGGPAGVVDGLKERAGAGVVEPAGVIVVPPVEAPPKPPKSGF